jgi:hypothetical protein
MKKLPVFTAALALGFLFIALYGRSKKLSRDEQQSMKAEPQSRHLTDAFAKAKNYTPPEEEFNSTEQQFSTAGQE